MITIEQIIEDVNITVNESDSTVQIDVVETLESVNIQVAEAPYIPLKWIDYVFQYEPSTETIVAGGSVIQYTADNIVYRFIPEPYVYSGDAFYTDFDGTTLSNLLVTRL